MKKTRMNLERLEPREQPSATAVLAAGTLTITADADGGRIDIYRDGSLIVVRSEGNDIGRFAAAGVTTLNVVGGAGDDVVRVANDLAVPTLIGGGGGVNKLSAGGGTTVLTGGPVANLLIGGTATNTFSAPGSDRVYKAQPGDPVVAGILAKLLRESAVPPPAGTTGLHRRR